MEHSPIRGQGAVYNARYATVPPTSTTAASWISAAGQRISTTTAAAMATKPGVATQKYVTGRGV